MYRTTSFVRIEWMWAKVKKERERGEERKAKKLWGEFLPQSSIKAIAIEQGQ